jgi:hypothetical protein
LVGCDSGSATSQFAAVQTIELGWREVGHLAAGETFVFEVRDIMVGGRG